MVDDGLRVGELAELTGKHRNTVRTALTALAEFGLARRQDGAWVSGPASVAEVAEELGAAEHARLRRTVFEHQREAFRWAIERERWKDGAQSRQSESADGRKNAPGSLEQVYK